MALLLAGVAAHAAAPAEALTELSGTSPAFHSRTCGLVLLAAGRAQVRAEKQSATPDHAAGMAKLTAAFMLLRDGQTVEDRTKARRFFWERLSTGELTRPAYQPLPEADQHCITWFNARRLHATFDRSEEAQWSAAQQAQLTLQTE